MTLFLFVTAAILQTPGIVLGLQIVPVSWTLSSSDTRYLLVVVSPMTLEDEQKVHWDKTEKQKYIESQRPFLSSVELSAREKMFLTTEEALELRARYHVSGLYLNDGSARMLWALPEEEYLLPSVVLPSDGKHLVSFGDLGSAVSETVLTFYDQGKPVRSYTRGDLVTFPFLLGWVAGPAHPWRASHSLDEMRGRLRVTTKLGDRFVFDIRTGNPVSVVRFSLMLVALLCALLVIAARVILKALRTRKQSSAVRGRF